MLQRVNKYRVSNESHDVNDKYVIVTWLCTLEKPPCFGKAALCISTPAASLWATQEKKTHSTIPSKTDLGQE